MHRMSPGHYYHLITPGVGLFSPSCPLIHFVFVAVFKLTLFSFPRRGEREISFYVRIFNSLVSEIVASVENRKLSLDKMLKLQIRNRINNSVRQRASCALGKPHLHALSPGYQLLEATRSIRGSTNC